MPKGSIFIERRKHKRVAKEFKVSYKIMPKERGEDASFTMQRTVKSADISISGIQLLCDEKLETEQMLRIDIEFDGEKLVTFAEVRWVSHDEKIKKYRAGMEFLVIKEEHISAIQKITGE